MKNSNLLFKSISTFLCLICLLNRFDSLAQQGNALNFDGTNDRVYIGNYSILSPTHITVQAWITANYAGSYRGVVTKRNCCGYPLEQWTMQTELGKMHFHAATSGDGIFITDPNPLPLGVWTQYTFTYDGDNAILYKNGEIVVQDNNNAFGDLIPMNWPVYIGDRDGGNDPWPGSIDEVRIWDHALSKNEILATMNCELTGNESGLIAYYNFNQGIASGNNQAVTTPSDLSPNHLDGTLENFALSGAASNWVASGYPALSATISASGPTMVCKPSTVTLTATPTSNGLTYQWKKDGETISGATDPTYEAAESGNYKCKVNSDCGSATSSFIEVTINSKPKATITPSGTVNICEGQSIKLVANSGSALNYLWKKDGGNITGATNQIYDVTQAGNYKVKVTKTTTGCSKTSKATTVNITCKGNDAQYTYHESRFAVFPNPGNGKFFVEFSSDEVQDAPVNIQLLTVSGQIVFEENKVTTDGKLKEEISLSSTLPDGIYLLQVQVNDQVYREKVVLQK